MSENVTAKKPSTKQQAITRKWRTKLRSLMFGLLIITLFILTLLGAWYYYSGHYHTHKAQWENALIDSSAALGLKIENVYLEGQQYAKTDSILAALNIHTGDPLLPIDLREMRTRLEAIDWINYAVVERQLPNTLHVRIVESVPIALWQDKGKLFVIDSIGNVIDDHDIGRFSHLIVLVGKNAPHYANAFFAIFRDNLDILSMVASAIHVGERRWNIRLHNGIEIKLPEQFYKSAWEYLVSLHHDTGLLHHDIKMIDLRIKDKLYILRDDEYEPSEHLYDQTRS